MLPHVTDGADSIDGAIKGQILNFGLESENFALLGENLRLRRVEQLLVKGRVTLKILLFPRGHARRQRLCIKKKIQLYLAVR